MLHCATRGTVWEVSMAPRRYIVAMIALLGFQFHKNISAQDIRYQHVERIWYHLFPQDRHWQRLQTAVPLMRTSPSNPIMLVSQCENYLWNSFRSCLYIDDSVSTTRSINTEIFEVNNPFRNVRIGPRQIWGLFNERWSFDCFLFIFYILIASFIRGCGGTVIVIIWA